MTTRAYDVVIVGGSWAGLAGAMMLGRARRDVLLLDAGRPRNRFSHGAHGFLGQDGRAPMEIVETLRAQVLAYPTIEFRADEAVDARAEDGGFTLDLASGGRARARRIVLATGVEDVLSDLPGLRERWGKTVLHCPYCHGYEVADTRLGALAANENALHSALLLRDWSADVTLFTNGVFTPNDEQRALLAGRGIRVEPRRVNALVGDAPALEGVQMEDGDVVPLHALFAAAPTRLASPLAERLGCALDDGVFGPLVRTDARKETTVPGVFAAGDLARQPHNATWAASDGVTAGVSAHQSLVFPQAPGYPR